jgi:CO/xanthine dehydrogenase FAD-binding subunit
MKLRLVSPEVLIDINGLTELAGIREDDGAIAVGSLTRYDQIARSPLVRQKALLISEAANLIADQQVRNRGTIGGSLAHADPNADLPLACTAANATIITASVKGSRSIQTADFFRGYFTTALMENEVIREVRIPIPPPRSGSAYLKLTKGDNDFAIVGVAAQVTVGEDHLCRAASVVLGGVASTPTHVVETEKLLIGRRLDDRVIEEGAQRASEDLSPPSDIRATAEYRLEMVKVLTRKAVKTSVDRAQGGS